MKRLIMVTLILALVAVFSLCGKKEEKIDIVTARMLEIHDTIPLEITHLSPIGKTTGYGETFKLLIGFNQPMIPLQRIQHDVSDGPLMVEPPIRGKYRWLGTRTLAFVPDDTIRSATTYEVKLIKEKIKSLTGMTLSKDTTWTFESMRPRLLSSLPYQGSQFTELDAYIYLQFDMEMLPDRIGNKIKIYYTKGMPSKVWCGDVRAEVPRFRGEIKFSARQLRDEEKKDYPLRDWQNNATVVLVPKGRLPVESQIEIVLYPGLLAKTGNLGLDEEKVIRFNTYNRFSLIGYNRTAPGEGALQLCFSNPVNMSELVSNIRIEPEIEIPAEYKEDDWQTSELYLYLPFKPNRKYDIRLSRGLEDIYGNRIDKDYRFAFEKGDYTPHVEIPTGINIIEAHGDLRFPLTVVNVDSIYLQVGRLGVSEAVPLLTSRDLFYSNEKYTPRYSNFFRVDRYVHTNALQRFRNRQMRIPIELKEVIGDTRAGLLFLQLDHLGQTRYNSDYRYQKAFLEVSDIGVTWKYSPENNLIWATSLHDTKPLSNIRVQMRSKDNRVLWEGTTDADGFCDSPGWAQFGLSHGSANYEYEDEYEAYDYGFYEEPDIWLTLSGANDAAVYSNGWNFGIDPWRFNISYDWYIRPEEYAAYIFTEKGLYRSGETVHVKGIIRKKHRGQWVLSDAGHTLLVVRNARGEEIVRDTIRLSQYASFHLEIPLNSDAPTGVYSINARLIGKPYTFYETFRVEAYRPAEFEVKVNAVKDTFLADENFTGTIEGRYLFGMPMKDAEVTWSLRRSYHYLHFSQHEGYQFGEYIEGRERELLSSGRGRLDQKGEYGVSSRLSKNDLYAPSLLYLEGVVTAPNMTAIAGEQNWLALNADYLIGLKTEKYLYVLGDSVDLSVVAVTPSGSLTSGKNIRLEIYRTEWKSIKKARLGGRYEWISEKIETRVDKQNMKSHTDASTLSIVPESPGYYYVRAYGQDNKRRQTSTRVHFYVAGPGYAGWEMRDDDMIEMVADRDEYRVGDTARILVKSPYDSARCLVTVERELVIDKFVKWLRGNADYVKIPIKSQYLPNVYVCVTLLRGRVRELDWNEKIEQDLGKPQFKIGYVNLKVSAEEKRLHLTARPDKADYRPRDSVVVLLNVKDHMNRPAANTEVALFVVDLGVLNLINFQTPDPFRHFYGSRPLSVRTIESRVNILGERSYGEKGEERGGGGAYAEGVSYREKFIATAFYKADLRTDKNGAASVRFRLPDNLTKFRIMAVAHTKESQFGSAESTLVVSLPFMMTPSIPRFARVGDSFKAGVVLHNRTDKREKASVECSVKGLEQLDGNKKEITLLPNTSKEVLFRYRAQHEGQAVFEIESHMGEERDAVKMVIPISLPPFSEAVATFSSTRDSAIEALVVPSQIYENVGGVEVMLSPTVLAGMDRGIEFLIDYPYYCLEQLMSKILPLIVGEKLINEFDLATFNGQALRDTVQSILDAVSDYQKSDGGFVYFKESDHACAYLSAYTMFVLHRARAAGYSIERRTVDRGIGFLHDVLRWQDIDWTYPYDDYARLTTRAFVLYSLSLWGEYEHAYATRLFENRNKLSVFGKTLLLKSGRILGMGSAFENELRRDLINRIKVSPTSAHFEEGITRGWTFPSPAKVTAFVMQTIIELEMPFPYVEQVLRWLVQERSKKTKPTTHENAFVFHAFLTYYERYESAIPDFTATVLLGTEEIINETFRGRTNEKPRKHYISFEGIPKDTLVPVTIRKQGSGRIYYTLRMNYSLKEKPYPFDAGFYVWKEITSLDGRPARKYKRGEVYKVVLHVVTPETRLFAVVDDPLPAGFVPVQTFFATESHDIAERYRDAQQDRVGHWWGSFDHEEYYDDRILFFAQQLFPGEHTRTYFVRAVSEGRFLIPQTKVEEMYAPEVFGTSVQDHLIVE